MFSSPAWKDRPLPVGLAVCRSLSRLLARLPDADAVITAVYRHGASHTHTGPAQYQFWKGVPLFLLDLHHEAHRIRWRCGAYSDFPEDKWPVMANLAGVAGYTAYRWDKLASRVPSDFWRRLQDRLVQAIKGDHSLLAPGPRGSRLPRFTPAPHVILDHCRGVDDLEHLLDWYHAGFKAYLQGSAWAFDEEEQQWTLAICPYNRLADEGRVTQWPWAAATTVADDDGRRGASRGGAAEGARSRARDKEGNRSRSRSLSSSRGSGRSRSRSSSRGSGGRRERRRHSPRGRSRERVRKASRRRRSHSPSTSCTSSSSSGSSSSSDSSRSRSRSRRRRSQRRDRRESRGERDRSRRRRSRDRDRQGSRKRSRSRSSSSSDGDRGGRGSHRGGRYGGWPSDRLPPAGHQHGLWHGGVFGGRGGYRPQGWQTMRLVPPPMPHNERGYQPLRGGTSRHRGRGGSFRFGHGPRYRAGKATRAPASARGGSNGQAAAPPAAQPQPSNGDGPSHAAQPFDAAVDAGAEAADDAMRVDDDHPLLDDGHHDVDG